MEVVVGSYEEFLLGYKQSTENEENLVQSFADKSHAGPLKCVAVQDHLIATGATDDRIFIYDMRARKQRQIILAHKGSINALSFTPDKSYLLSGSDDGYMIATCLKNWTTDGKWKAHNGLPVTHICCHPSAKLALSLGGDRVLCTWNLVKGRVAYRTNLKSRSNLGSQPDCLAWSINGSYFTICGPRVVEIWSIETADVIRSQNVKSKPTSICWISDESIIAGSENGEMHWINANNEKLRSVQAHAMRVKALAYHNDILISVASSGEIKTWAVDVKEGKLKALSATNTGCRPTCLAVLDLKPCEPIEQGNYNTIDKQSNDIEDEYNDNAIAKRKCSIEPKIVKKKKKT